MSKLNFVFFTFGEKLENYTLCVMAILSAKKFQNNARFIIYTDRPEFFKWASFLTIKQLSKEQIQDWKGEHNYIFRVKLKAIEDAVNNFDGHIVYMDSDIFVKSNLDNFISQLDAGNTFMHLNEGKLKDEKDEIKQAMYHKLNGSSVANIPLDENMEMWNSGILALPENLKHKLVQDALLINDELRGIITNIHTIEQFAFGISLKHNSNLQACDSLFIHYWGNKPEWHEKIEKFLAQAFVKNLSVEQMINEINLNDWTNLPINRARRSINKRITKFINKHFSDKLIFTTK